MGDAYDLESVNMIWEHGFTCCDMWGTLDQNDGEDPSCGCPCCITRRQDRQRLVTKKRRP